MSTAIRVLLVEDSALDGELVLRQFGKAGVLVESVRVDSEQGLSQALEEGPWHVVIGDYNIPGFSGTTALSLVRKRDRDLPFIFVSGSMGEDVAVAAMRVGANDYVMKDNLHRLVPAVERELRDADARRERRRAESELRRSQYRFAQVFRSSPVGIAVSTLADGEFVEVNQAFARLAGATADPASAPGRIDHHFEPEDLGDILARLGAHEVVRDRDMRFRKHDGTHVKVLASFERIELGSELCLLSLIHDVSERVLLEDQLRQAHKMEAVGRLAGGVAHDFNNLLTVILGYCEGARDTLPPDHEVQPDLAEIGKAARRASDLTRQLLAFSRRQVIEVRHIAINDIVLELEPMLRRLIPESIVLERRLARAPGSILADAGQLEQVLINLVVNARDAMPDGGTLTIATATGEMDPAFLDASVKAAPGSYVILTVRDTGIGMDDATRARIFEPFFTTKPVGEGTGLGLSTVYGAVKQNGGFISVSSAPGAGTTFRIYLPDTDAPIEKPPFDPVPESLVGSETILLVEDEVALRSLTRGLLRRQGYSVLEAADGPTALAAAAAHAGTIDLLLTDVVLPGMNGRALSERLASLRPAMLTLFTSGYMDDTIARQGFLEPGVDFLQKPFTPESLWRKVRSVLDAARHAQS